jgi:hypothetical protein
MSDPPLPKGDGLGGAREILAEELECGLHPTDGWDLSAELDKTRARVDRINGEHATEAERLSHLVMEISNALVNLGMLPVQDIPQLQKSIREVLSMVGLVLEHLQEELASDTSPWLRVVHLVIFPFFFSFSPRDGCNIHFNIYFYIYIYKDVGKLMLLHL